MELERILLVGFDAAEAAELSGRLPAECIASEMLPRIVVERGQLFAQTSRSPKYHRISRVIFHGIFEHDLEFLAALALWGGPCFPNATAMMNCRLALLAFFIVGLAARRAIYERKPELDSIAVGQGKLQYSTKFTKAQAEDVAAYLTSQGFYADNSGEVVLFICNNRTILGFKNEAVENRFTKPRECRKLGEGLSTLFHPIEPIDISILNEVGTQKLYVAYEPLRPDLPIKSAFRSTLAGGSLVFQIQNSSDKFLQVKVSVTNPTTKAKFDYVLQLPPGKWVEHGWAEGWSYHSGDEVIVINSEYETISFTVN